MGRCEMRSSIDPNEQCREEDGHPCYSHTRFHRFHGCDMKSWCCLGYGHDGDCLSRKDLAHFEANRAGCGDRTCFTCVQILHTMLPPGMAEVFPLPAYPAPTTKGGGT